MIARPRRHARSGFTLVEVLATLVLVGVVLPVAMQGIGNSLAAADNARHSAEAAQLAQNKLTELILTGDWQYSGTTGDFGIDWPGYSWIVESGTSATALSDYGLTEVRVSVAWQSRGKPRQLSVSTFVEGTESALTQEVTQ